MPSPLSSIAPAKRRQLAATLGLFAVLFVAIAAVAATNPRTTAIKAFIGIALVFATALALMGWGVLASVRRDLAERRLDDAIEQAVTARGGRMCDCGHDHDPTEMHIVDVEPAADACAHDGSGVMCSHSCDTCVLASLRPEPVSARPSPRPRPSPR